LAFFNIAIIFQDVWVTLSFTLSLSKW